MKIAKKPKVAYNSTMWFLDQYTDYIPVASMAAAVLATHLNFKFHSKYSLLDMARMKTIDGIPECVIFKMVFKNNGKLLFGQLVITIFLTLIFGGLFFNTALDLPL